MTTARGPARPARAVRGPRPAAVTAGEALERARGVALRPAPEWVPLARLAGRRLAGPVTARADLPAGDSSAMDGWAVRAADGGGWRSVVGESAAGHAPLRALAPGEAWRISTGALLPDGADAVVRREHGAEADGRLRIDDAPARGADVRPRGDDLRMGQELLPAGALIAAHETAVVAAAGHQGAFCRRPLRVAVVTTGDELVTLGGAVPRGGVPDVNLVALVAQIGSAGATVCATGHAPDRRDATVATLAGVLDEGPDLLVTVGGISVGEHDHVGPALGSLGARWTMRGVAMRPGHPVGIAERGATVVLALPGNPAAAVVCFHLLGRALLGAREDWAGTAELTGPVRRHPRDTTFVRCSDAEEGVVPLARQGAAQVSSLAGARVLAWVAPGAGTAPAGTVVPVSRMP